MDKSDIKWAAGGIGTVMLITAGIAARSYKANHADMERAGPLENPAEALASAADETGRLSQEEEDNGWTETAKRQIELTNELTSQYKAAMLTDPEDAARKRNELMGEDADAVFQVYPAGTIVHAAEYSFHVRAKVPRKRVLIGGKYGHTTAVVWLDVYKNGQLTKEKMCVRLSPEDHTFADLVSMAEK